MYMGEPRAGLVKMVTEMSWLPANVIKWVIGNKQTKQKLRAFASLDSGSDPAGRILLCCSSFPSAHPGPSGKIAAFLNDCLKFYIKYFVIYTESTYLVIHKC